MLNKIKKKYKKQKKKNIYIFAKLPNQTRSFVCATRDAIAIVAIAIVAIVVSWPA